MKQIQVKYSYDNEWTDKLKLDGSKEVMKDYEADRYVKEFNNGMGKLTNTVMRAVMA